VHRAVIGEDILRSAARLSRWASRHADLGVPAAQARVLSLLDELGPTKITDLAQADNTSQPTMTTQIQRLEAEGLVTRNQDPDDARASRVSITGDGLVVLARVRWARGQALAPLLADIDPDGERLRQTADLLAELLDATAAHVAATTGAARKGR
jgi:DNA-binding MarR family transcriptional regulator